MTASIAINKQIVHGAEFIVNSECFLFDIVQTCRIEEQAFLSPCTNGLYKQCRLSLMHARNFSLYCICTSVIMPDTTVCTGAKHLNTNKINSITIHSVIKGSSIRKHSSIYNL